MRPLTALIATVAATLVCAAGAEAHAAPARPPDPLAAARYLALQRAGFGSARQAAIAAAVAQRRAGELRVQAGGSARIASSLSGAWQPLGPSPVGSTLYGGAASGRVDAVAVRPDGEIFAGTAGGGVWSSSDGGAHWVTHTDRVSSGLAIGALAIDPSDPQTIYAGTGEADNCGDCFYGGGLLKSTDGGLTWTVENPGDVFSGVDFAALAVDPHNHAHLYAATTAGLYESQDGGSSWAHPTGTGDFTDPATDVVLDTTTGAAYVATTGLGLQVSTDGGTNFTTLGGGLPAPANVAGAALAIGTATSANPTADRTMYAAIALNGATDPNGGQLSLYQSTDGGTTWTRLSVPAYANQAYAFGSGTADQATFDNAVVVDPANPAHLIVGGISALESTDGGGHWTDLNGQDFFGPGTNVLHPDVHALAFTPAGTVVLGTDGGVFGYEPSTPGPGGISNLNTDLDTALAYQDIGVSGDGTAILAGMQDNGTALYGGSSDWPSVLSGNGGYGAINPLDGNEQLAESDGDLIFTTDAWASEPPDITPPGEPSATANFVPPAALVANPWAPDSPTVYYGGGDLWATSDPADPTPVWTRLTSVGTGVSAIAVAPSDPSVIYVGFDDGTLEVSNDAGSTFTAISPGIADWITHIAVDPANPARVALTFSDSNTHAYSVPPMVQLGTVSLGGAPSASFGDITGDLPSGVASNSVLFDGGSLVVATDVGVFATETAALAGAGTRWSGVAGGLPNVQVIGLTLDGAGNLYAATHGRGIWELPAPPAPPPPPPPPPPRTGGVGGTPAPPTPPHHTSHPLPPPPPSAAAVRAALSHLVGSPPRLATLLRQGTTLTFSAPGAGRLQVTWTVTSGRRQIVVATLRMSFAGARRMRLHLSLTAAGRRALRGRRRAVITSRSSFTPDRGRAQTVSRTIFSK